MQIMTNRVEMDSRSEKLQVITGAVHALLTESVIMTWLSTTMKMIQMTILMRRVTMDRSKEHRLEIWMSAYQTPIWNKSQSLMNVFETWCWMTQMQGNSLKECSKEMGRNFWLQLWHQVKDLPKWPNHKAKINACAPQNAKLRDTNGLTMTHMYLVLAWIKKISWSCAKVSKNNTSQTRSGISTKRSSKVAERE